MTTFFDPPRPRLFAHRGDSVNYPENTVVAFDAAVRAGVQYLETDVHLTRDGTVVISHDATVERASGQRGAIASLTFTELAALDVGYTFTPDGGASFPFRGQGLRYPTLDEVLRTFPDTCVNMEIKAARPGEEEIVATVLRRARATDRVCVAAFVDLIVQRFRDGAPDVATSMGMKEVTEFVQHLEGETLAGYTPPGQAMQVPAHFAGRDVVTDAFVAGAHAVGLEVHVWTVNDPTQMRALLHRGTDGIMSDDPATLVAVAREMSAG